MARYTRLLSLVLLVFTVGVGVIFLKAKVNRTYDWKVAEEKAENAVVQVVCNNTVFNWLEPYKAPRQMQSYGTAFFIDSKGTMLTNFHVVDEAKLPLQIYVPALGQKPMDAIIVGVCPEADVAMIRLKEEGVALMKKTLGSIPSIELGDSDALYATEPVLAMGYPLCQRYIKSTVGVVAGREYLNGHSYMHITAPINPGNSGGPLLNLEGKVVGINTAGIDNSQSIGYIVPIYDVQILLKDLATTPFVRKPDLGIHYNTTTEEHVELLGNPLPAGVYINSVEPRSIAEKAGIKSGDMLYAINGRSVDLYGDVSVDWQSSCKVTLEEYLVRLPLNEKLNLRIYRNGKEKTIKCIYSPSIPQPIRFVHPDYEQNAVEYEIIGGMCVMQLRLNHLDFFERLLQLHHYRLTENHHKEVLIITKLLPGSPVHRINCFYEGAILTEVNGKLVKTLADLRDAMNESSRSGIISLKSKDKLATAFSVDMLLKEEGRITRDFMFSSTQAMKDLKKNREEVLAQKKQKSTGQAPVANKK